MKLGFLVGALVLSSLSAATPQELPCHECPGTLWYIDASQTGFANGRSWQTAYPDLQTALANSGSGDCIWVAAGDYKPTATSNRAISFDVAKSLRIYGGFGGDELCLSNRAGLFTSTTLTGDIGTGSAV